MIFKPGDLVVADNGSYERRAKQRSIGLVLSEYCQSPRGTENFGYVILWDGQTQWVFEDFVEELL